MNKDGADAPLRVNLEINPRHAVIRRLAVTPRFRAGESEAGGRADPRHSLIAAGLLDDPTSMIQRLYKILESV